MHGIWYTETLSILGCAWERRMISLASLFCGFYRAPVVTDAVLAEIEVNTLARPFDN
jgi:hypothetical protein